MARFTDRVAIVTGAGSGLGRATARRLASEEGRVAVVDLDEGAAAETVKGIEADGCKARAYTVDVSDWSSVEAGIARVANDLGRPEVLVNCAGVGGFAHTESETPENWNRIIGVNLTGTFLMCRGVLGHMLDGGGAIVNIASSQGLKGQSYSAAYCASKGGVVNLTRALGFEYRARGVRVNVIAPGGMNTDMISAWRFPEDAKPEDFAGVMTPIGFAEPEEVASLIAFVASDEGRYMVGQIVGIDGGITCA